MNITKDSMTVINLNRCDVLAAIQLYVQHHTNEAPVIPDTEGGATLYMSGDGSITLTLRVKETA